MLSINHSFFFSADCLSYSTRSRITSSFLPDSSFWSVYSSIRSIYSFFSHSYSSIIIIIIINYNNNYYYYSVSISKSLVSNSSTRQISSSTHTSSLLSNKWSIHPVFARYSSASYFCCFLLRTVFICPPSSQPKHFAIIIIIISYG